MRRNQLKQAREYPRIPGNPKKNIACHAGKYQQEKEGAPMTKTISKYQAEEIIREEEDRSKRKKPKEKRHPTTWTLSYSPAGHPDQQGDPNKQPMPIYAPASRQPIAVNLIPPPREEPAPQILRNRSVPDQPFPLIQTLPQKPIPKYGNAGAGSLPPLPRGRVPHARGRGR